MSSAYAGTESFDIEFGLQEFAELDCRRLFGSPALEVSEVEHWLELRARLELHLARESAIAAPDVALEMVAPDDRREFIRLPTHIVIHFSEPMNFTPQVARDVSQGGLFIATRRPLEVDSKVHLQLEHGVTTLAVSGTVAWARSEDGPEGAAGMGIRFGDLDFDARRALSRFVQDLASQQ